MGDAEDAQLNGFQQIAEFNSATYLLCFFHVLYNVRNRTRHLSPNHRKAVTEGIMRIHYTADMNTYYEEKEKVLDEWKMVPQLTSFVAYFTNQWLENRY
ncbi:hypothetical protein PHYSODRAFT_487673 [Phytophthora sojae]|uniref:MULE transposase domain-containing protein n=1 Tax=Phytophthora sojae (strain P6497) TaxID=1094619 RepID=G4Z0Z2_PHYSP|nr:hypothetical protein PHYSODRAFT_487673 [Phytophthora sojae]EGZ23417.1 hypothetical protein PHYSODRAFT_487673 [Phytophthora sojae]|eukprot:XP_009518705.1 hypothetical protein PHYSODRAFT_487673 [Phytophthora sojae]